MPRLFYPPLVEPGVLIKPKGTNNNSPRLTVPATVISKRTNITHHHNGNNVGTYHTSTTYYAAFQVESGDRMELQLDGSAYGLLAEGDKGKLTFQGTRFLGFERT